MADVLAQVLMVIGAAFMLIAAVGVVRMPDLFTRVQAAAKAATLGAGLMQVAVAVHFGELGVTTRALTVVVFLALTAPVAAHVIGRAAYFVGVPRWGLRVDELSGRYDVETHALASEDQETRSTDDDMTGPHDS
jgi:multicomponent Na+:H+ antiporter subunit G